MSARRFRDDIEALLGDTGAVKSIKSAIGAAGESGDTAAGFLFAERYRKELCYVPQPKEWRAFEYGIWVRADAEIFMQTFAADRVTAAAKQLKEANKSGDEAAQERAKLALYRASGLFNDRRVQERALKQARPHMIVNAKEFNRTAHLLGVRNGVLSLKTLEFISARSSDYISKRMGCDYDPRAKAPQWIRFIEQVLPGDAEREFFQRAVGAALFGVILDNGFVFMLGESGDNGKSVACNVLAKLFGEYCMIASPDLLLQTKHDTEHKRLMATLSMGPRLVLINETPRSAVWDDARVKQVGSRDELQARWLYGETFGFTPVHHVFIRGNHAPGAQDTGDAFWKRVWPVGFDVQIPKSKQVRGLDDLIVEKELAGVFTWALEGAAEWRKAGAASGVLGALVLPQSMVDRRESYRAKTDYAARWLLECTAKDVGLSESRGALWASYQDFCRAAGLRSAGIDREFYDDLEKRGFRPGKSNGVRVFRGLRLNGKHFDE